MEQIVKGYKVTILVAVCSARTGDIKDEFDTMAEAKAYCKECGYDYDSIDPDVEFWYLAAEWLNEDGDLNMACWGKTRKEAVDKLKANL